MGGSVGTANSKRDNLETFHLIWLDTPENSLENNEAVQLILRESINHLRIFVDKNECQNYINNVPKTDRIVFIVTGRLGEEIVLQIHHLRQISSIYIFCMNTEYHKEWSKNFSKVRGVVTELPNLIKSIRADQNIWRQNRVDEPISVSIFNPNVESTQWTIGPNVDFIYSFFLNDFLLRAKPGKKSKNDLISLCKEEYKGNSSEISVIESFTYNYSANDALYWYARDSFICRLLDKALRVQNVDLLLSFRFLLHDMNTTLCHLQCLSTVNVYRSQLMSQEELYTFKDSIGKFIIMNSFLSTILSRTQAIHFVQSSLPQNELYQTLFEVEADPKVANGSPFAAIKGNNVDSQDEVLFMTGSIFQLTSIHRENNQLWIVRMKLSSINHVTLKPMFDHITSELNRSINILSFIRVLRRWGKSNEAEKYCLYLCNELAQNDSNLPACYQMLGDLAADRGNSEECLEWHEKSLECTIKCLDSHDPKLLDIYTSAATVYRQKGFWNKALDLYKKALTDAKMICGEKHACVAEYYTNIANIHQQEKQWYEALNNYLRGLVVLQSQPSINHSQVVQILNSMADCHINLGLFELALQYCCLSLETLEMSDPSAMRDKASILYSIGRLNEKKRDLKKALEYYQKASDIYDRTVSATHIVFNEVKKDIERISAQLY